MKKYKLIKEYPGSPDLGTIVEKREKTQTYYYVYNDRKIGVLKEHVEDNPEYWEAIDFYQEYLVSLTDMAFHNAWESRRVHGKNKDTDTKKYFKTEEEAKHFILYNKPCLSINDIGNNIPELTLDRLIQTVKSRL